MSRPPKPYKVIQGEGKSHRTKAELNQRKKGEEALATGTAMKMRPEVKKNPIASKEYKRVNDLLKKIGKNDAIHELVINRYCMLVAECDDLMVKRERCYDIIIRLDEAFENEIENTEPDDRAKLIRSYSKTYNDNLKILLSLDGQVQTKRRMLLDIEKENIMTIAAALRSIPKTPEQKKNPLLEALGGG